MPTEIFEQVVEYAVDLIPKQYTDELENLAFFVEDYPNYNQRAKLQLRDNQTLFGLYEGVPLPNRGMNYSMMLPDKITIFQKPIEARARSFPHLVQMVRDTVWHEIAHYFGLNEEQVRAAEHKSNLERNMVK